MELTIRKMTGADLEPLAGLLSDPRVMRYLEPPYPAEKALRFLQSAGLAEPPLIYAVERDGEFIGYVIWHDYDEDSMEIGWVLKPECWGQGYASSLTEQMIKRTQLLGKGLVIECLPKQEASRRIAQRFGFAYDGIADGLAVYRKPDPARLDNGSRRSV